MGYRSEVLLVLAKPLVDKLNAILQDTSIEEAKRNDLQNLLNRADNHFVDSETGDELWYWECVKWYYEYPSVKIIHNIIEPIAYNDYMFIRLGEDFEDTELHGTHDNNFGVAFERTILYSEAD